jgi:hypothetical protein
MFRLMLCFVFCLVPSFAFADFGSRSYADQMNRTRAFRHDRAYRGAEVIHYSSRKPTEASARAAWMRSRPHAALLRAGRITEISCVGNYCVGRGR